jgi:hypothetical protein
MLIKHFFELGTYKNVHALKRWTVHADKSSARSSFKRPLFFLSFWKPKPNNKAGKRIRESG